MRLIGSHRVETMNPTLPFPHSASSSPRDPRAGKDEQPCDDTTQKDDAFDTQLVDFNDETQFPDVFIDTEEMDFGGVTQLMDAAVDTQVGDLAGEAQVGDLAGETQVLDLAEETQVMDLAGDTQVMDLSGETQVMDLAGETQVMDDYELTEQMNTQLLYVPDSESDGGTEFLDDTVSLDEIESPDKTSNRTTPDEEHVSSRNPQNDGGAMFESLPSDDTTRKSGKGVVSRVAGLPACKIASDDIPKSDHNELSNGGDGKYNKETLTSENDIPKSDHNGLSNEKQADITRSLARKLFTEEDEYENGSEDNLDVQKADLSQLPGCDNELAGLSYVDSQEPGELSQANALNFVDRFLKINLLEPDQDAMNRTTVSKSVIADSVTPGAKSIAQEANRRSTLAGSSIFDWDENVEDEGGGEFFIKKKDLLIGTGHGARKSGSKPGSSRLLGTKGSQSVGRIKHKGQRNLHGDIMGLLHSDTKLVISKKIGKVEEITGKGVENHVDQELALANSDQLALATPSNDVSTELMNVGVDTQMAAEAMETLATGTALVENVSGMTDQNPLSKTHTGEVKERKYKTRSFSQHEAFLSKAGVSTRSKRAKVMTIKPGEVSKCLLSLRSRSQLATEKLTANLVTPKGKQSTPSMGKTFADRKMKSLGQARNAGSKGEEINREAEQENNQSLSVTGRITRKKASTNMIVHKTPQLTALNRQIFPGDVSNGFRERRHCVDSGISKKRKTRSDLASGYLNSMAKNSNVYTVTDSAMVDSSSDRGRDFQYTSRQANSNNQKVCSLTANGGHEVSFGSISRRTRSKRTRSAAPCKKGTQTNATISLDKQDACSSPAKRSVATAVINGTPPEMRKATCPADTTPVNLRTPRSAVSPVCVGDEYHTPSRRRKLSLMKELGRSDDIVEMCSSPFRILRQRRDMNSVKVFFSQHLDEDVVRQQRKILSRLGVSEASSIMDATHFVADMFVRTRNMLEAIANAKLIVTSLWLESCGQANSFIDEKKYILRDTKKEKELGFSMPMSLACASRHPLLEGRRVLITDNVKPSKEIILSLVKAVHGQALGRLGRSTSNNDKLLEDMLIISCEEDFEVCVPLLEKGINVYGSELLLSGIITQKLEYDRYHLFMDHVKKTRSSLWLKKDGDRLRRVQQTK